MADLSRWAREYFLWDLGGLPADYTSGLEISVDDGASWHTAEVVTEGATKKARVLIAGPNINGNPAGTVVLPTWGYTYRPKFRLTDNPEVVIRGGGMIYVA